MNEDEDIIRLYAKVLARKKYWIIGAAVLAGLLAFGYGLRQKPSYQSTALVLLSESTERVEFDPRITSTSEDQPRYAFPEIAVSDGLLENLLVQLSSDEITTVGGLRDKLEAELHDDPKLLYLRAKDTDAVESAIIANHWAELFVNLINSDYSTQGDKELLFYEEQMQESLAKLERSEQTFIEFQASNRSTTLNDEINRVIALQKRYLTQMEDIEFLMRDTLSLQDQLASRVGKSDVTLADQLTTMFLQLKAFNAGTDSSLQLQFDPAEAFTEQSRQEQLELLEDLNETLTVRLVEFDEELLPLEPKILALQRELQEIETEEAQISRDLSVAEETYTTLARKVEEERIESQYNSGSVLLASPASVPERSSGASPLLMGIVAGIAGFGLASAVVLALFWWNQDTETSAKIPD